MQVFSIRITSTIRIMNRSPSYPCLFAIHYVHCCRARQPVARKLAAVKSVVKIDTLHHPRLEGFLHHGAQHSTIHSDLLRGRYVCGRHEIN